MNEKIFNLADSNGFIQAFDHLHYLKAKSALIVISEVKRTRTSLQNRALHLFFTWCADSLNERGIGFVHRTLFGVDEEIEWNLELVKKFIWQPIQITLFEIESTTQLKTNEIDTILEVIQIHFSQLGINICFPSRFDMWLKKLEN